MITRNFYIALLAFVCIILPGAFLFREAEAALQAVEVVAFAVAFTLVHVLDDRDRRRSRSDD